MALFPRFSHTFEVPTPIRDAVLVLAEITPAVRYPGDDQPIITIEDALQYPRAANEVYDWAVKQVSFNEGMF